MRSRAPRRIISACLLMFSALAVSALSCNSRSTTLACNSGLACREILHYPLVVGASGTISTLDPNLANDPASRTVVSLLYDGLVTLDQHLRIELWGAKRSDVSADGLTYTFHLRAGQAFANGVPVTAADYAFSINRALNPCLASPAAQVLYAIKDAATFAGERCVNGQISLNTAAGQTGPLVTTLLGDALHTPDDSTLVITLAQPAAYFLAALANPVADALDPGVVNARVTIGTTVTSENWLSLLTTAAGTSGLFQLATWDAPGGSLVVKANTRWWGRSSGTIIYLHEIDFTLFKTADDAYAAYQSGKFHLALTPPQQVPAARVLPDFHAIGTLTYNGLSVNWTKPPFNDLDARQAFCLAVNRDALTITAYSTLVVPRWNIVPQGMPGYNPAITGPDGVIPTGGDDAAAARHWAAYLTASGANPAAPIAYLYDTSDPAAKIAAQTLQAQWQQALGVQVLLRGESHAAWQHDVDAGNYIITPERASLAYPDPQAILSQRYLRTTSAQLSDVPSANMLMALADVSGDEATRLQEYQQAEQLLVTNVVTCPLFQSQLFYQIRPCVHQWYINANGLTSLDTWTTAYIDNTCPNA